MYDLEIDEEERFWCWLFVLNDVLIFKFLMDFELFDLIFMILYGLLLVFVWFVVCVDIFWYLMLILFFLECNGCVKLVLEYSFVLWCNIKRMFDIIIIIKKNLIIDIMYIYSVLFELDIIYLLLCWFMVVVVDCFICFWVF